MNTLTQDIIKPFLLEQTQIKKIVGIYAGRFQPFGPHHKKTYEWMKSKFDDAYITTSGIRKLPRHPLSFRDKATHMSKMGIPKSKIIKEKIPYVANKTLKKFDSKTTAVVYIFGEKDAGRLMSGKYFQDYKSNKDNLTGYDEHGYILTAPHVSVKVGGQELSGTAMRNLLGSDADDKTKKKLFKKLFGYYSDDMYKMFVDAFVSESLTELGWPLGSGPTIGHGYPNKKELDKYMSKVKKQRKNTDSNKKYQFDPVNELYFNRPNTAFVYRFKGDWMMKVKTNKAVYNIELDGRNEKQARAFAKKYLKRKFPKVKLMEEVTKIKKSIGEAVDIDEVAGVILYTMVDGQPRYLLLRDDTHWSFPKGHLQQGESLLDGAMRETYEETGIVPGAVDPKFFYEMLVNFGTDEQRVITLFLSMVHTTKVTLSDEHQEYKWATSEEVEALMEQPDVINLLNRLDRHFMKAEDINVPVNVGDTVLVGKFKNKKIKVKSIGKDKHGMPTINGRKATTFRIHKKVNIFDDIDEDLIERFISSFDMKEFLEESSTIGSMGGGVVDDGPRYWWGNQKSYRTTSEAEVAKLGWRIVNYLVPEQEFEIHDTKYPDGPTGAVSYYPSGKVGTKAGTGVMKDVRGTEAWKKWVQNISRSVTQLGWTFVDWIDADLSIKQTKNEPVDEFDPRNEVPPETEPKGEKDQHGEMEEPPDDPDAPNEPHKKDLSERALSVGWWKNILERDPTQEEAISEDIKPDVIKSFAIQDSLNTKIWDGEKLKPQIRKKLLMIGKNFFDDLELEPQVKLQDITLTGSISNYNWSKFSDVDLHLRIDFSQVDEDENFVKNYVLAKKTIWNNKHDINMYGFPVEVYVENIGDTHIASGLYSILKDKWLVVPKKKELQIDLEDIATKAEGYLGSVSTLEKLMKEEKYSEVIRTVEKIQERLKRMRSSGLERGGEFSVENLAFKALRRSPFIGTIVDMKTAAYDAMMTMNGTQTEGTFSTNWWKQLITEGGAYGHMAHPFDDWDLTFKDFKNIIEMGLSGNLNREDNVTEKLDGQNLMISWKGGNLIIARNKGHIKNAGKTALSVKGIASMFSGRGEISNAFSFAAKDLQKAIGALSNKQRDKIFMNGRAWMNLEVLWPASSNVIDYDVAQIVFHGALEYNDAGTVVGQVKGSARTLEGMIRQVNQHIQKHYKIAKPQFLTVPKNQDFTKRKTYYFNKLKKLQDTYALADTDTLSLWHQMFWQEWIMNGANQTDFTNITNDVLVKLMKRWAFGDKSYKISDMKKELRDDHPEFLAWALATDKVDVQKIQKQNMKPFEVLFFELGAEILHSVSNFLAVHPSKSAQKMKTATKKAAAALKRGGDPKNLKLLKTQLEKLQSIGGFDAVVPSEGLVFKYKGNTYKFTGAFAPVNQITGALKFGR